MGLQSAAGGWTNEGIEDAMAAMIAADPFAGAKLHLYKSSFSPTKTSVQADFDAAEADFTGYAAVALTYSAVGVDGSGTPVVLSNRVFFQATDGAAPNTIGGCWIQRDVTGPPAVHTALEYYEFSAPVTVAAALAFVAVVIGIQAPGGPGYALIES